MLDKKSQSLPLNTIVIAMLVIIVLLVIIVFFTGSLSKSGSTINKNSASLCSTYNPVITTLGYIHAEYSTSADGKNCANSRFEEISVIPKAEDGVSICGKKVAKGAVCCGTKIKDSWTCNE